MMKHQFRLLSDVVYRLYPPNGTFIHWQEYVIYMNRDLYEGQFKMNL